MILVANELLDCLPARQFVRTESGWAERVVGLGGDGELAFGLRGLGKSPDAAPLHLPEANPGSVWESSPPQAALASDIAHRLVTDGGAALLIDYGRDHAEAGDTLQAIRNHQKVDPLKTAGLADLTVWADFPVGYRRRAGDRRQGWADPLAGPVPAGARDRGPRPGPG
jgi:NADH dehydrogenase [ubiquinone] 1 alpha subcomplex assembly factor 7